MRVLFAGSPAIAIPSLEAVSELELEGRDVVLAGILTNPDRARRHGREEPSDLSSAASRLDLIRKDAGLPPIPQLKSEKLGPSARKEAAALKADLLVSFAYGRIFGPRFLSLFPLGGINIHPSLLPKYRGASPIPALVLAGEKETGICIQRLAQQMDAGDILAEDRFELCGRETTSSLSETVSLRAARLLGELLPDFEARAASVRQQEGEATYCGEIKKEAGLIDWNKSAEYIDAQIRAYTPWPLAFTRKGNDTLFILEAGLLCETYGTTVSGEAAPGDTAPGTVLGVDKSKGILIQTGRGILAATKLQWQAKKALDWKAFCNGARDFTGSRLG